MSVIDAATPDPERRIKAVREVLDQIGLAETPELLVFNQIDRLPSDAAHALIARHGGVAISALKGTGLPELLATVEDLLSIDVEFPTHTNSGRSVALTGKRA